MSANYTALIVAAILFVGSHFALSAPETRRGLAQRFGERPFIGLYSAMALIAFALLLFTYSRAPHDPLWPSLPALRLLPAVIMPFASVLLICGVSQYNPTSVIARFESSERDPAPGILKVTRHPVMWAIGLWALAHIPPNGDVASLIFFGTFALLALYGTTRIDAKRRAREPDGFHRFAEVTSNLPLAALLSPKVRAFWKTAYSIDPLKTVWSEIGLWRITAALALYIALIVAHPWITGLPAH
jgi:uncharacterized membrane protein